MMYYCRTCKEWFSEPEYREVVEWHDEVDTRREERYKVAICPYCKDDDITEVARCEICGEGCEEDKTFCPSCHDKIGYWLAHIQKDMKATYEQVQDIIGEHFGW